MSFVPLRSSTRGANSKTKRSPINTPRFGRAKTLLPPAKYKVGDVVFLRVNHGGHPHDFDGYHNKKVRVTFVDNEEEPRYLVKPVDSNLPALYFSEQELWEVEPSE
jgi:hypothetical protein